MCHTVVVQIREVLMGDFIEGVAADVVGLQLVPSFLSTCALGGWSARDADDLLAA